MILGKEVHDNLIVKPQLCFCLLMMIQTTFLGVGETANSSLMRQIGVDGVDFLGLPNSLTESDLQVVLLLRSGVDSISPSIVH